MTDLKCSECGCTVPPDVTRYPNCENKCDDVVAKAPVKNKGNGIMVIKLLTCACVCIYNMTSDWQ